MYLKVKCVKWNQFSYIKSEPEQDEQDLDPISLQQLEVLKLSLLFPGARNFS